MYTANHYGVHRGLYTECVWWVTGGQERLHRTGYSNPKWRLHAQNLWTRLEWCSEICQVARGTGKTTDFMACLTWFWVSVLWLLPLWPGRIIEVLWASVTSFVKWGSIYVLSGYWKNCVTRIVKAPCITWLWIRHPINPLLLYQYESTFSRCVQPTRKIPCHTKWFITFVLKQPSGCPHLHQDREYFPKKPCSNNT